MHADELRALRKELGCTAKELAETLGIDGQTVTAWEKGDAFPTKRWVEALEALRAQGPGAVRRKPRRGAVAVQSPMQLLADPELWVLVRKLLSHAELRRAVTELAAHYDDPKDSTPD
jgi:transcriptional regulator with XRE-family HTH domain